MGSKSVQNWLKRVAQRSRTTGLEPLAPKGGSPAPGFRINTRRPAEGNTCPLQRLRQALKVLLHSAKHPISRGPPPHCNCAFHVGQTRQQLRSEMTLSIGCTLPPLTPRRGPPTSRGPGHSFHKDTGPGCLRLVRPAALQRDGLPISVPHAAPSFPICPRYTGASRSYGDLNMGLLGPSEVSPFHATRPYETILPPTTPWPPSPLSHATPQLDGLPSRVWASPLLRRFAGSIRPNRVCYPADWSLA